MPYRAIFLATWVILAMASGGCSTAPRAARPSATVATQPPLLTEEEIEARAESHARFAAALAHELNQEPELALDDYYKAAKAGLANDLLILDVSRRLYQANRRTDALQLVTDASSKSDASGFLFARLGFLKLQEGDTNAAIQANRTAIRRQPDAIPAYQNLYQIYNDLGNRAEARQILLLAKAQSKADSAFLVELAELYLAENRLNRSTNPAALAEARSALIRAADLGSTNLIVLSKLADGLNLVGERQRAADLYLKLVEEYPNFPGLREKLADLYLRSRDGTNAAVQLQEIIRDNPTNPQAYFYLGALAYEERNYSQAIENYDRVLLLDPSFEQVYYDKAAAQLADGHPEAALATLQRARARFQSSFVLEFFSGLAHNRLKQFTEAIKSFTAAEVVASATDTNRLNHLFYFHYGMAYERAGQIPQGEKLMRQSISLSPDFAEALNYLGYMWAERGTNLTEAAEMIGRALKQEPKNAAFLDSLAWVYFKQGKGKEALDYMQRAIEKSEEPDATLYDHLGDIFQLLHQGEAAADAWKKSLNIEPNPEVKSKLEKHQGNASKPK